MNQINLIVTNKNIIMTWLAVDNDGEECIYDERPIRNYNGEYWEFKRSIEPRRHIVLPKGSIEKLIGRKLTWEDDPVELK